MRFLLGLILTLVLAAGLTVAGFVLLSSWQGPTKPTVSSVPNILLPKEVQASIKLLPPLVPPPATPRKPFASSNSPKRVLPFKTQLPSQLPAKHLVLTSLSPAPLEIQTLDAIKGKFSTQLKEGCYQIRGFNEEWEPLFRVDRFCMGLGAQLHPADIKALKNLKN